jgi:hypothetical protein
VTVYSGEETDYQGNKIMEDDVSRPEEKLKTIFDLGNIGNMV